MCFVMGVVNFVLQVLEIHEQLDRPPDNAGGAGSDNTGDGQMTESEKAIVREMCNVRSCNLTFFQ